LNEDSKVGCGMFSVANISVTSKKVLLEECRRNIGMANTKRKIGI